MSISIIQRLINCLLHAGHLSLAVPEKARQIGLGTEAIELSIVGHIDPVDCTYILAPTENLTHEAFNLSKVDAAVSLCKAFQSGLNHLHRMKHFTVQSK